MIIDFHTHIFPDKIANATLNALSSKANMPYYSDGTARGIIEKLNSANVDIAVNLPVLTKATQFESVLKFAITINQSEYKDRIISFCGMHPNLENLEENFKLIKDSGIKGFKLHPEYQNTFIDDERYVKIMLLAKKYNLIVVTHAGVDEGFIGEEVKCSPKRVLNLLDKIGGYENFVLAHYGGNLMYKDVYKHLAGTNVYFDTACILSSIKEKTFNKILARHGEDKILFATDSPWRDIKKDVSIFNNYKLPLYIKEKIFYKNALNLLNKN